MNRQQAFDSIVAEFARDMQTVRVRKPSSFIAVAPSGAEYFIRTRWQGHDVQVIVDNGPRVIHNGQWVAIDSASRAAQVALATISEEG